MAAQNKNSVAAGTKPVAVAEDGTALLQHGALFNPILGAGSGFGIVATTLADQTCEIRCFSFARASYGFSARVPVGDLPSASVEKFAKYLSRAKYRAKLRTTAEITRLVVGAYDKAVGFTAVKLSIVLTPADAVTCALAQFDYREGVRRRKRASKMRTEAIRRLAADTAVLAILAGKKNS